MAKQAMQLKVTVQNVDIGQHRTQNVRFRILPRRRQVRVTTLNQPALFVKALDDGRFSSAPRKELPVVGNSPAEAAAKGMKRFWKV